MEKISKQGSKVLFYSILWAITYIGCLFILKKLEPSKTLGLVLSFMPTITFALFIYNFIKAIDVMDEVERRIQLEAAVWGFSLGLLLLMTLGLLDLVVILNKEDWGYRLLIPYFFAFYLFGIFISRRKYHYNEKPD
jgi:hypothetical protein